MYKITIEKFEPDVDDNHYAKEIGIRTIYEQIVEDINIVDVIKAVNEQKE